MRKRRVPRTDATDAIIRLIQACENNSETKHIWEPAMLAVHAEIERVFELNGKQRPDESYQRKADLQRRIEEKRFRFKTSL